MAFDARAAKLLQPGEYLLIGDCPGLRLTASEERRSWAYRYKSPVDGKMRQVQIGRWPVMSPPAAMIAWEALRSRRDAGEDPALAKKQAKAAVVTKKKEDAYTVRRLCDDYLAGHVDVHRGESSRKEMRRLMSKHLDAIADRSAQSITRSDAFDLLESMASTPVSAQTLRGELGAAWDYALDAGRLPDSVPNWWRLVMRGRLKSKGKSRGGVKIGTIKRVLSQTEIGTLLRWMPKLTPLISDALTLYLWTAVRGVEIMAMEKEEIQEERDGWWWTIPKRKTKNARHENATDLRVPLVGKALAIVHRRMSLYDGYLFPAPTKLGHTKQQVIGTSVARRMSYNTVQVERNLEK
ncbi:MAG: alpha/beta hydrolase, partial [Comamonadaceae bacterium CG12_big_fil_rev_8_21_14_0_65_59_15]